MFALLSHCCRASEQRPTGKPDRGSNPAGCCDLAALLKRALSDAPFTARATLLTQRDVDGVAERSAHLIARHWAIRRLILHYHLRLKVLHAHMHSEGRRSLGCFVVWCRWESAAAQRLASQDESV